jgi:hypothetical protein
LSAGLTGRKVLAPLLGVLVAALLLSAPTVSAASLSLSLKAKLEGNVIAVRVTGTDKASVSITDSFHGRTDAGPKSATVEPGRTARADLPLSQALIKQLAKTPRGQKLTIVVVAKGRNAAGTHVKVSVELAVPGRGKPPKDR